MPNGVNARFRTTSWTLIEAAAAHPTADSREALATLCQAYWPPVYAFIRRNGYDSDLALDLSQEFFSRLIEKNYLTTADRTRGRFRSFLLASVRHFLANERERANALKRGGGQIPISIDIAEAESWYATAIEEETPETLFERRWALSVVENVTSKILCEFSAVGKADDFHRLFPFLNNDPDGAGYEAAAGQAGMSAGALRMAVHRLRRKFRDLMREEIASTVSDSSEIDDEVRSLLEILSS
jgi:RNA polymerase sigma-70 factor (ECF subfamily)